MARVPLGVPPKQDRPRNVRREPPAFIERHQVREAVQLQVPHLLEIGMTDDAFHKSPSKALATQILGHDHVKDQRLKGPVRQDAREGHQAGSTTLLGTGRGDAESEALANW